MFFFKKTCRVSVRDKQVVIETKSGTNLYKLLVDEKLIRPMLCGGTGQCGKCKIKYASSKHIPKPTYKETLILAKSNIDAGYRLACQQSVKRDMEIDISEISSSAKFLSDNASVTDTEENSINENNLSQSEETDNLTEKDEQAGLDEPVSLKDFTTGSRQLGTPDYLLKGEEGPGDGILLIQQRSGIRYYCYSAALDNIVAEGTHPYNEQLRDIIDNDMLPDFLYTELKIRDVERVMALIEANDSYGADILMDMFRYMRFDIGMQQFEMIMPKGSRSYEITHFFRLLNADDDNKLIFSLDMLSRTHYATPKIFTDMRFPFLKNDNLTAIKPRGLNPILSFDNNLNPSSVEIQGKEVDGIALTALLQFVKLLHINGIINNKFQLKSRIELSKNNIPLDMSVRIYGSKKPEGYYIHRDRFSEILLTQNELDEIYQIRSYIRTVIEYSREYLGTVDGLIFYTSKNHDDLINLMFELDFIPKEYSSKIIYRPGESTVHAIKLFKEKDVPTFLKTRFHSIKQIDLIEEDGFKRTSSANSLEI